MVFVIIDTNVLLQFRLFDQVDWAKELGVPEATVVFAPVVFAELDKYKWAGTRRQKERARTVLKILGTLALSTTPVSVRQGLRAIALDEEPGDALFVQHRLHPQSADDRLLASYFGFVESHPGERVLVLSADSGLATKARSRRIEIIAPADVLELPDEPDELVRELEKTRRELADIKSVAPDLRLTFGDGQTHGQFEVQFVKAIDYRTKENLIKAWQKKYPHTRPTDDEVLGIGGQKLSLGSLAWLPGYMSEKDATDYNAGVDRVFAQYEAFLRAWPAIVNGHRTILPFNAVLENSGTAPALDVDVQLWTDAPGIWIDELPKKPTAPGLRKARSPYDIVERMRNVDYLSNIRVPAINANEDGPNFPDGPNQRVQYSVKRVIHHVPCELPVVYFQFESDDAVASFTVNVRLIAANIRKPKTDALHVEIALPEAVAPPPPPEPGEESEG